MSDDFSEDLTDEEMNFIVQGPEWSRLHALAVRAVAQIKRQSDQLSGCGKRCVLGPHHVGPHIWSIDELVPELHHPWTIHK